MAFGSSPALPHMSTEINATALAWLRTVPTTRCCLPSWGRRDQLVSRNQDITPRVWLRSVEAVGDFRLPPFDDPLPAGQVALVCDLDPSTPGVSRFLDETSAA